MICLMYFLIKPVNNGKKEKNHEGQKLFSQTLCTAVSIEVAVKCVGSYLTEVNLNTFLKRCALDQREALSLGQK